MLENMWMNVIYTIKITRSGLSFFYFLFSFLLSFDLFPIILFLELGLGLEWQDHAVTQQITSDNRVTSHIIHERM